MGPNGNRKFRIALFDYRADRALETAPRVAADDVVLLLDGVFLQRPELDGLWDLTVWVDAPFEITVERSRVMCETAGTRRDRLR
jgi:uridine kinase